MADPYLEVAPGQPDMLAVMGRDVALSARQCRQYLFAELYRSLNVWCPAEAR
jgi:hypothetical protein